MDYDPDAIDSFAKLKVQFTSFGGLSLEADDEERFFVACEFCLIEQIQSDLFR